jgi:hypothetical protein
MKHYLVVHENKMMAAILGRLLQEQDTSLNVHVVDSVAAMRPVLLAFPVSVVFIPVTLWGYTPFIGMIRLPAVVFICTKRKKIKTELLGDSMWHLAEPYVWKDLILLQIKIEKFASPVSLDFMFVKFDRRFRKVNFTDIELVEKKDGMYVLICTVEGNFLMLGGIRSWLERLPKDRFVRIADDLIVPKDQEHKVNIDTYEFKGRQIALTFRFLTPDRSERRKAEQQRQLLKRKQS